MNMKEFQEKTLETAVYPHAGDKSMAAFNYCLVGLLGEAGELANKWKKVLRGDLEGKSQEEVREVYAGLRTELQDVLWYVARSLDELGANMGFEAEELLLRLARRKERGTVKGSGDSR